MVSAKGREGISAEFWFCEGTIECFWMFGDIESENSMSKDIEKWMDEGTLSCMCIKGERWSEQEA